MGCTQLSTRVTFLTLFTFPSFFPPIWRKRGSSFFRHLLQLDKQPDTTFRLIKRTKDQVLTALLYIYHSPALGRCTCAQSFPGIILFLEEDPVVAGSAEQGRAAATVKALWLAYKISSYWQSLFILHICPTITRYTGFF